MIFISLKSYKNFCVFDSGSKCEWELDYEYKRRMLEMIEYLKSEKIIFSVYEKTSLNFLDGYKEIKF